MQPNSMISTCISTRNLMAGKTLHSHLIKTVFCFTPFMANRLIELYARCNAIESARKLFDDIPAKNHRSWNILIAMYIREGSVEQAFHLFDKLPERNIVTYNSLISGLSHRGLCAESMAMFRRMQRDFGCLCLDEYTAVSVVSSCARLGSLQLLKQVHGAGLVTGLEFNMIVHNALIDSYGKCGEPYASYRVFHRMDVRDEVSWTAMVATFARASLLYQALQVFTDMPLKTTISWTSLISGFVQNHHGYQALDLFKQMQEDGVRPNDFTIVTILNACADLSLFESGKQIHAHVVRTSASRRDDSVAVFVFNSLIDMYCKCGDTKSSKLLFQRCPEKDIVSWNTLVTGYARNGNAMEAIAEFQNMAKANLNANHVTFLGLMFACSHAGLFSEAILILESMERDHGVRPEPKHYAILIDMLGRKNRLDEAIALIKRAPGGRHHIGMWGSALGACRLHEHLDRAEEAANHLFCLEPMNAGRYIMLSNVYAAANRWNDVNKLRSAMAANGLKKEPAFSWVDVRNTRHEFVSRNNRHDQLINDVISMLIGHVKEDGNGYSYHTQDYS